MESIRRQLVDIALQWERLFGNAPQVTSVLSEFDAAMLVGMTESEYSKGMQGATAVQKGFDFLWQGDRYQIKANRPSGKPGSRVTLVAKARNYEWDLLIWILYNKEYEIQEAYRWTVGDYKATFHNVGRLSPNDYRQGTKLR